MRSKWRAIPADGFGKSSVVDYDGYEIEATVVVDRIAELEAENREAWDNETDQKIRADKAEATIQRVREAIKEERKRRYGTASDLEGHILNILDGKETT